ARVVDEDVDAAIAFNRLGDRLLHLRLASHIAADRTSCAPLFGKLLGHVVGERGIDVGHHGAHALPGQGRGALAADAPPRSCDDGNFPSQVNLHGNSPSKSLANSERYARVLFSEAENLCTSWKEGG